MTAHHHHQGRPGSGVTEPLREEHRELLPNIDGLEEAADSIGLEPLAAQRRRVGTADEFLRNELIPHAIAEDQVLYEEVDRLLGKRGETRATDTMRRDHAEVARLTERLGQLRAELEAGELEPARQSELRSVLYGLHTLVRVHFAKEEEVYLPLLDRELEPERAQAIFAEMEEVKSLSSRPSRDPA